MSKPVAAEHTYRTAKKALEKRQSKKKPKAKSEPAEEKEIAKQANVNKSDKERSTMQHMIAAQAYMKGYMHKHAEDGKYLTLDEAIADVTKGTNIDPELLKLDHLAGPLPYKTREDFEYAEALANSPGETLNFENGWFNADETGEPKPGLADEVFWQKPKAKAEELIEVMKGYMAKAEDAYNKQTADIKAGFLDQDLKTSKVAPRTSRTPDAMDSFLSDKVTGALKGVAPIAGGAAIGGIGANLLSKLIDKDEDEAGISEEERRRRILANKALRKNMTDAGVGLGAVAPLLMMMMNQNKGGQAQLA